MEGGLNGPSLNSFQSTQSSHSDSFLLSGTAHSSSGGGGGGWGGEEAGVRALLRVFWAGLGFCLPESVMVAGSRLTLCASGRELGWRGGVPS